MTSSHVNGHHQVIESVNRFQKPVSRHRDEETNQCQQMHKHAIKQENVITQTFY